MLYFAYGSNLHPDAIAALGLDDERSVRATLPDHRLAFTRRSTKRRAGVADLAPSPGHAVPGKVFEVDRGALELLDRKEGVAVGAYVRTGIVVRSEDGRELPVMAYRVARPADREIVPTWEYVHELVESAAKHELPDRYREFLERLRDAGPTDPRFSDGLAVRGTIERPGRTGLPQVRVGIGHSSGRRRGLGVVDVGGRAVVVEFTGSSDVRTGSIEVDQAARHVLGLPGPECYGDHVHFAPVRSRGVGLGWSARTATLSIRRPARQDSEREICTLHETYFPVLGVGTGDHVRVRVVARTADGGWELRQQSFRAFSGSATSIRRGGTDVPYPLEDEVYIDRHGRDRLGLPDGPAAYPAVVSADVGRVVVSNLVRYAVTLGVGLLALPTVVERLATMTGRDADVGFGVGLVVALVTTVLIAWVDVRARVSS